MGKYKFILFKRFNNDVDNTGGLDDMVFAFNEYDELKAYLIKNKGLDMYVSHFNNWEYQLLNLETAYYNFLEKVDNYTTHEYVLEWAMNAVNGVHSSPIDKILEDK